MAIKNKKYNHVLINKKITKQFSLEKFGYIDEIINIFMGFVDKKIQKTTFDKNKTIKNLKSENKNFREIIKKL